MATLDLRTKSRDEYKQLAHIGRGAYGDVFLCEHVATGEHVCLKEMDLTFCSPDERMRCLNEVAILKQLPAHPNIVELREAFWAQCPEENQHSLVLVLEHADNGDLEQHLSSLEPLPIREEEMRRIFVQLVQGVNHLHRHRVVHRDLKTGNAFLFRCGRVVLGDFGTSKLLPPTTGSEQDHEAESLTSTVVGSPLYMSPELLENEPHGFATDIWSLGCVLYEMLSGGKPAFGAPSYPAVVFRITQGEYDPLDSELVSSEARDLLAKMLQKEPQNRPSIAEVLQSSWLEALVVTNDESQVYDLSEATTEPKELVSYVLEPNTLPYVEPNIKPTTVLVHPTPSLPSPAPMDSAKLAEASPPPAPVTRKGKSPVRPHRNRRESDRLQGQATPPLIRLDEQPPTPPVLPSRKRLSSIPFKHYHLQHHDFPVQPTSELEIRGIHMTRTARQPKSTPRP